MSTRNNISFIFLACILSVFIIFIYKHIFSSSAKTYDSNTVFPNRIADWTGEDVVYDKEALSVLSTDRIIYKSYHRSPVPPITLFIGYYNTLEKADYSHSPVVCFTGQGWKIENTSKKTIPIDFPHVPEITVNQMIQRKHDTTMIALFWYQSANRSFSNRGFQKVSLFFDKLLGKVDSNAFVRITVTAPDGMSAEELSPYLFSFVQDMYPELRRFFLSK